MRQRLTFTCEGETLSATLDSGSGTTGLLIVSGGNEIRIGSHRGMAKLAADVAAAGQPVRKDDTPEVFEARLREYYKNTAPLIGYYYAKQMLTSVDGLAEMGAVSAAIAKVLDKA